MKNKTVICHFYNEEYLLPWWLKHHREIFDSGLMINYGSTDNSLNIIRDLCPSWRIVDTKNQFFGAIEIDREIEQYEKLIDGYRIVLNVTEFLIGNVGKLYKEINNNIYIPMISMVDTNEQEGTYPNSNLPLTTQRLFGVNPFNILAPRSGSRILHQDKNICYPIGRHFWNHYEDCGFYILRYKHSPWNELFIKRKMQIGKKQPITDLSRGWGTHHQFGREELFQELAQYRPFAEDISPLIKNLEYLHY